MRLRFLQTTPSANPDVPFQPGQVIQVARLTPEMQTWVASGLAEVFVDEAEAAVLGEPDETAVEPRPKPRGKR
jgi:hypothetical protein